MKQQSKKSLSKSSSKEYLSLTNLDKQKPKELDWTKTIQNSVDRQIDLITIFHSLKTPQDLDNLFTQQRTELLEEIKKDIVGSKFHHSINPNSPSRNYKIIYNQAIVDIINLLNKKDEK